MHITEADIHFYNLVKALLKAPTIVTRNAETHSIVWPPSITFTTTPLVTIKKTAWKKALREMEWFLSGNAKCPEDLLDWWGGQLNPDNKYLDGYSQQFQFSSFYDRNAGRINTFNQIEATVKALRNNPNSRRIILTAWNPGEMANITDTNDNPNTPTTCHSAIVQFFVRDGKLSMYTYQRSADILLGVQHNWIQSWAMLTYFARMSKLEVGTMMWQFGDLHLYGEESHIACAKEIINNFPEEYTHITTGLTYSALYQENFLEFRASDFNIICYDALAEPLTTIRPKLL